MIYNKIIPSFYFVELMGDSCAAFFPKDFKIQKINVTSQNFESDILAYNAADKIIIAALSTCNQIDTIDEALNPDFFPSAQSQELSESEIIENELETPDASAALFNKQAANQVIEHLSKITNNFDELGDFIQQRTVIHGKNFSIVSKIAASPVIYASTKGLESVSKVVAMTTAHREIDNTKYLH